MLSQVKCLNTSVVVMYQDFVKVGGGRGFFGI